MKTGYLLMILGIGLTLVGLIYPGFQLVRETPG